jgi:hypothetical protein
VKRALIHLSSRDARRIACRNRHGAHDVFGSALGDPTFVGMGRREDANTLAGAFWGERLVGRSRVGRDDGPALPQVGPAYSLSDRGRERAHADGAAASSTSSSS